MPSELRRHRMVMRPLKFIEDLSEGMSPTVFVAAVRAQFRHSARACSRVRYLFFWRPSEGVSSPGTSVRGPK